jgi:hypothetical protein
MEKREKPAKAVEIRSFSAAFQHGFGKPVRQFKI